MALRGSAARRSVGDPLGGVLRDLDRRARTVRRRPPAEAPGGPVGASGGDSAGMAAPVSGPVVWGAEVTTDQDGRCAWEFPAPSGAAPVVTGTAVGSGPLLVVVESVGVERVTLKVWSGDAPAGAGVRVNVTAVS